jgi:hypothetical protein
VRKEPLAAHLDGECAAVVRAACVRLEDDATVAAPQLRFPDPADDAAAVEEDGHPVTVDVLVRWHAVIQRKGQHRRILPVRVRIVRPDAGIHEVHAARCSLVDANEPAAVGAVDPGRRLRQVEGLNDLVILQ